MMKSGILRRKKRIRAKVTGTKERPRISVFKSNKLIYAQVIDDTKSHTLVAAYGKKAEEVGKSLGETMIKLKIKKGVFDRGGYKYHGNIKILADAVRKEGVEF